MKVGIMQPYFFPYLGYWQLINAVDKYVVYDDVNFIKGGWISRNNILLNGSRHLITLPLYKASSFKKINEIEITKDQVALMKVLKLLESAYKRAPYFETVMPLIKNLILNNSNIAMLNYNSIIEINQFLGIKTEIILSSELEKDNELKGEDKVIHINKILGSDTYINAIGGKTLYGEQRFKENGLDLFFLNMGDVGYKQFGENYVNNLSIIDVLMFNDVKKINEFLNTYNLDRGK